MSAEYSIELVERRAGREETLLSAEAGDLEWLRFKLDGCMEAYRLYHRGELVGTHRDVNDAFEEMHRRGDPPHRREWYIMQGDESVFGDPHRFGQTSIAEVMEGDA